MDKSTKKHDKIRHADCQVHKMPSGIREIHKSYGLWICSMGRNKSPFTEKFEIQPRYFEFFCISHMIEGSGFFWIPENQLIEMNPGDAVIITPETIHEYGAYRDFYHEDTVCFTGEVAEKLRNSGVIKSGVVELGKARKLLPVIELALDPSVNSQLLANMTLQNLIFDIYKKNNRGRNTEKYPFIKELIDEIRNTPSKWWTVSEMAEFCNLSVTHFNRIFHEYTGISPKTYIDRLKIQLAAESISGSASPINEVAKNFGYLDPFHFSRRFKQITGFSPSEYRKQSSRS